MAKQEEDKELESLLIKYGNFLLETIEVTSMTKSFKSILLESFLELDGFVSPPGTKELAERSWIVLNRRPYIKENDLSDKLSKFTSESKSWHSYWLGNPTKAYTEISKKQKQTWFTIIGDRFQANFKVENKEKNTLHELMQELVDYKLAQYTQRIDKKLKPIVKSNNKLATGTNIIEFDILNDIEENKKYTSSLPFYPLEIAAGGFAASEIDEDSKQWIDVHKIGLSKSIDKTMFISQIHGHSMEPSIPDGSYCLFKYGVVGSRNGRIVLVKKSGYEDPDTQASFTIKRYYSQKILKSEFDWGHEKIELRPENPDYPVLIVEPDEAEDFVVIAEFLQLVELKNSDEAGNTKWSI